MEFNYYKKILDNSTKYPTVTELIYRHNIARDALLKFNELKYDDALFIKLPLFDPANKPILYYKKHNIFEKLLDAQNLLNNTSVNVFNNFTDTEIINGFIFSEIEATLSIEGIRSTRAQILRLKEAKYEDLKERNDIIVKNMLLGYEFAKNHPLNEQNIYKLYNILAKNCLGTNDVLLPENYYRHDDVYITDAGGNVIDRGVEAKYLDRFMKQLIAFINNDKSYIDHLVASHIIHYYLIYLHPYFDYNGRMARVLSFWYNFQKAPSLSLLFVSEAINNKAHKGAYYSAIMNSRQSGNDITYFLEYMSDIILKYAKVYINFYEVLNSLKASGEILPRALELTLKQILALDVTGEGYFSWQDYSNFDPASYSKQYYLRQLNKLVSYEILEVKVVKNAYLYRLNHKKWNLF